MNTLGITIAKQPFEHLLYLAATSGRSRDVYSLCDSAGPKYVERPNLRLGSLAIHATGDLRPFRNTKELTLQGSALCSRLRPGR